MYMKKWLRKPVSTSFLWMLAGVAAVLCFVVKLLPSVYDYDVFFLIATGEEIVQNGIPYVNPWAIDSGLNFVAQQWLYAVLVYLFYTWGGKTGLLLFVALQIVLLYVVLDRLMYVSGLAERWPYGLVWKMVILVVTTVLSQTYLFSVRPEAVSLLLLACQCLVLETGLRTDKPAWFLLLPVIMILEMNLHGSMWPFHYCILLAYVVPAFWLSRADNFLFSYVKQYAGWLAFVTVLMTGAMFLNPYGLDGILYIIRAHKAGTFGFINIAEMASPGTLSGVSLMIFFCLLLVILCYRKILHSGVSVLSGVSVNLAAGFGLIAAIAVRNCMFLLLPVFFLLRDFCCYVQYDGLLHCRWRWYCRRLFCVVMIILSFVAGYKMVYSLLTDMGNSLGQSGVVARTLHEMCSYIEEQGDMDAPVFAGFNTGAYLEFYGFRNVYMDARPELYLSELNGKRDILAEYSRYCLYGMTTAFKRDSMPISWIAPVSSSEMEAWLSGYDFSYLVVVPVVEVNLAGWLLNDETYKLVEECSHDGILLYEKKGMN